MKTVLSIAALVLLAAAPSASAFGNFGKSKKPAEPVATEIVPMAPEVAASSAEVAGSSLTAAPAAGKEKGVAAVVVDKVKECAAQKLKLEGCKQLKWPASSVCKKLADKGACLGL